MFQNNQQEKQLSSWKNKFDQLNNKKKEPEETFGESFLRQEGQQAARIFETLAGFPGNFKKAAIQFRDFIDPELGKLEEQLGKYEEGSILHNIMNPPTSMDLRQKVTPKVAEALTGEKEYFEPKNKFEKLEGDFLQDISSFFLPGSNRLKTMVKIGAPLLGNLTSEGLKYLGVNEQTAEKAKFGMMLATTLAGQSNPAQFAQERIEQSRQMVPQNMTVDVGNFANRLMPLFNRLTRGLRVPSKSKAIQGMQDLSDQVQNNRLPMQTLMDARNDINEWIAEARGWDVPTPIRDRTLANLNEFKTQVIRTIEENLAQRLPQAGELYRTGYEAAAVTHRSHAISNFIENYFGKKVASVGAKLLFPGLAGGAAVLPKTAAVGAGLFPLYKTGQVLYRVAGSPTLARYYRDVIIMSTIGNVPAMVKSMEKLDKALAAEEKKQNNGKNSSAEEFREHFKKKG